LDGWNAVCKRAFDLFVSLVGLLLTAPITSLAALLIKLTSPGPVFYGQQRVGLNGRTFRLYKFRTMRVDAEADTGPVWASREDPRTTAIGRFLRRTSLDELPQLFNVLRGDMSIVGPRPERPHFVEQFQAEVPRYMDRHRVKAGLTGWAQVNGQRGADSSIEERTRYDIYYVENWSLLFDFQILVKTAFEFLFHKGAG
jgi:exopolysaccharide biosynthesis polyprenyl glycosylphosphotransferase